MHTNLNSSSSPSDEINIQGDNSQSYRRVENQAHAGIDRAQADHAKMSDKMTLAYSVSVLQLRGIVRRRFLDPNVVHAVVILQKFQDHRFVPVNLAIIIRTRKSALFAEIFGRELDLGMLGVFALVPGEPFIHLVMAAPQPQNRPVVGVYLLPEICRHRREVLFALLTAKEVLDVFSDA